MAEPRTRARAVAHFDQGIADALIKTSELATGLPRYLGLEIVHVGPGQLTATMPVRTDLLTPFGSLHGGVMAGLVDHVLGCVVYPMMQPGQWAATTEFKLNYLAAVRGGTLVAESTVLTFTKRTAVVRVEVTNEGQLGCVALGTLLIVDPKPPTA